MITEFVIGAGCVYLYRRFQNRKVYQLKENWKNTLENARADGIRNMKGDTFEMFKVFQKPYGYLGLVSVPSGLKVGNLENAKDIIQDSLHCLIEIEKENFKDYIKVKVITKQVEKFNFEPIKTYPNQLYLGKKIDGDYYKINLNTNPHIIISGQTGTGKSFLLASILTNLIYNHPNSTELYLLQITKAEIDIFSKCKNVRFTSNNLKEIEAILEKLNNTINLRSKIFSSNGIKNISQWNKHFKNKRMKRIIVCVEEISFFMNDEDSNAFKIFNNLVKAGRSVGIHLIALTQRTTVANLGGDGELKSQTTVITARQRSDLDSRNAIDIGDAVDLREREFIAYSNEGYVYFTAPYLDEDFNILNEYVPEIKIPDIQEVKEEKSNANIEVIDVTDYKKLEEQRLIKEGKIQVIDLSKKRKEKQIEIKSSSINNNKKGKVSLEVLKSANKEG